MIANTGQVDLTIQGVRIKNGKKQQFMKDEEVGEVIDLSSLIRLSYVSEENDVLPRKLSSPTLERAAIS